MSSVGPGGRLLARVREPRPSIGAECLASRRNALQDPPIFALGRKLTLSSSFAASCGEVEGDALAP
jgi:hypothetical protein